MILPKGDFDKRRGVLRGEERQGAECQSRGIF